MKEGENKDGKEAGKSMEQSHIAIAGADGLWAPAACLLDFLMDKANMATVAPDLALEMISGH